MESLTHTNCAVFAAALAYLGERTDIEEVRAHMAPETTERSASIRDVFHQMLMSLMNRQGMSNAIGDVDALRRVLLDFDATRVARKFASWQQVFEAVKTRTSPPGRMEITNPRNYWVIYSKGIVSGARYLAQFESAREFDHYVRAFDDDVRTRPGLPSLLAQEIFGLGFATACDFLKELGYTNYVKPDVHVSAICSGLSLGDGTDLGTFRAVARMAEDVGETPYAVDKVLWLIGSGYLHKTGRRFPTDRDQFVARALQVIRRPHAADDASATSTKPEGQFAQQVLQAVIEPHLDLAKRLLGHVRRLSSDDPSAQFQPVALQVLVAGIDKVTSIACEFLCIAGLIPVDWLRKPRDAAPAYLACGRGLTAKLEKLHEVGAHNVDLSTMVEFRNISTHSQTVRVGYAIGVDDEAHRITVRPQNLYVSYDPFKGVMGYTAEQLDGWVRRLVLELGTFIDTKTPFHERRQRITRYVKALPVDPEPYYSIITRPPVMQEGPDEEFQALQDLNEKYIGTQWDKLLPVIEADDSRPDQHP